MIKALNISFIVCTIWTSAFAQLPKGRIIFSSGADTGNKSELYIINSDGSNEHQLSHSGKRIDMSDNFQGRITYMQHEDSAKEWNILVSDMNFKDVKALTVHEGICNPKWQPGGKLIAYEYYPDTSQEIWVMDSDGKNKRKLVGNSRHPYWSADGSQLLFTRDGEVFSFDMKKGTETQLTHLTDKQYFAKWPAISPDNKKIAFKVYYQKKYYDGIMVLDLKNGGEKLIAGCDIPYWTSDNRYIVCSCRPGKEENNQIAIVNVETGEKTFITNDQRSNFFPAWVNGK